MLGCKGLILFTYLFCCALQPYLRRRKFKLFACFLEATMIASTDGPLEFEVSIGWSRNLCQTKDAVKLSILLLGLTLEVVLWYSHHFAIFKLSFIGSVVCFTSLQSAIRLRTVKPKSKYHNDQSDGRKIPLRANENSK